ncbi:MAG TPA: amino acid adenylation domain-containing protein, partial [Pyrinomonadaceae bacterium]
MTREQNLILTGAEYQPHARFWREQLSALGEGFAFRARLGAARDDGGQRGSYEHALGGAACRSLEELGKGQAPGKFVVLLSALYVALAEYSGHRVVALKTPLFGASDPSPLFEREVLLVGRVDGGATVRELVAAARETATLSYKHQNYPLELAAAAAGGPGASEATNVLLHAPGLHLAPADAERFELVVEASLASAPPRLSLSFLRESVDEYFARALARTVERALESFRDLDARLWDLDLLAPDERARSVVEFNATRREYPGAQLLHGLFEEQAAKTPERVAVVHGERSLTYGELNRQADAVARRLAADYGVGPEDLVGLMVGRSELMVAALLGVLKAGAAYVPIDPVYPDERIAHMLEDARPKVTLVSAEHAARAASFDGASALLELEEAVSRPDAGGASERAACLPDHPAYTLYTSGSTGRPKGVQVTHRAVVNFLRTMREAPGVGERDVLLAVTPLSFDIAALELYLPLTVGARVVVADRGESVDGGLLTRALAETGTTVMQATPASWRMLVESGWQGDGRLRAFTGGEALEPQLAARLLERVGELWNLYGPTETTIWSTATRLAEVSRTIPLGAPVANTQVYVLDEWMRPVCVGAPGELCIGGDGLARGYLKRPGLTAERFVPDPLSQVPGARLYKTGDLVRFLPDGEIEFLGRLDYQVKIRGFRIELGEVEAALAGQAGVRAAVVLARAEAGGGGGQRLVAYVVKDENGPDATALRARLLERLPDYMLPSAFVFLEALPLTPNGKVDRKALPEPDPSATAGEYVAPRTPVEEITCNLFAQVLRVPRVGTADNLFDLGGHSLMATQLVSRVREVFGVELPLRELFERPTPGALAHAVEVALAGDAAAMMQPITPAPRDAPLPLSFSQRRLWFLDQLEPGSLAYHIPIPVRISGVLDFGALSRAFFEVMRRHEALRTTFTNAGVGEPVQTIMPPVPVPLPIVDLSELSAKERWETTPAVAYEHTSVPFDLSTGPLINALVVRLAADDHYVLVTMHHIISDGWSVQVLARELSMLYAAYVRGEASPLRELPVQFGDYASWQRRLLQGELLEAQLSYWRTQLGGAPAALELPTDKPRRALRRRPAGGVPLGVEAELAARVREACRREGVTPFMLLLGCWAAVLARHSGREEVLVGSPVAGRRRAELEGLVGFFVNTLALRVGAAKGATWGGLLRGVREVCLGAYTHQEL